MEIDTIKRVARNKATRKERKEVEQWASESVERQQFLNNARYYYGGTARARRRTLFYTVGGMVAAASCLLFLWIKVFSPSASVSDVVSGQAPHAGIQLVLSNGSTLFLSEKDQIQEKLRSISREFQQKDGESSLPESNGDTLRQLNYNRVIVPNGTTYSFTLEDGSRIMLNAASTLHFPEHFAQGERKVYLEGEAYLEVAHNEQAPFWVETKDAVVRVLGTQFNVRSYPGKEYMTTLVDGKVEVSSGDDNVVLSPGEACVLEKDATGLKKKEVDLMEVLAWKNGEFVFKNMPLTDIMEELSRWYDIEVSFVSGDIKEKRYYIYMDRMKTLEEALHEIACVADITYRCEGKKVMIEEL